MALTIRVTVGEDNLFGHSDTDGIDIKASIDSYCDALCEKLHGAYPEAEVEVAPSTLNSGKEEVHLDATCSEDYQVQDEILQDVKEIGSQLWQGWGWVVMEA